MEMVYQYINKVVLKNDDGELALNHLDAFEENIDEILVRTSVVNTDLKRGWIGNLTYETKPGVEITDPTIEHAVAQNTFHDVLLAGVRVWDADRDSVMIWEYRFLKK